MLLCCTFYGLGNGLLIGSSLNYVYELAPAHLKASAQAFFSAVSSVAGILGNLVGGVVYDAVGAKGFYLLVAGVFLLSFGCVRPDPAEAEKRPGLKGRSKARKTGFQHGLKNRWKTFPAYFLGFLSLPTCFPQVFAQTGKLSTAFFQGVPPPRGNFFFRFFPAKKDRRQGLSFSVLLLADGVLAAHVRPQCLGDAHAAVGLEVVLPGRR